MYRTNITHRISTIIYSIINQAAIRAGVLLDLAFIVLMSFHQSLHVLLPSN